MGTELQRGAVGRWDGGRDTRIGRGGTEGSSVRALGGQGGTPDRW